MDWMSFCDEIKAGSKGSGKWSDYRAHETYSLIRSGGTTAKVLPVEQCYCESTALARQYSIEAEIVKG